jgi:hypothetical protein
VAGCPSGLTAISGGFNLSPGGAARFSETDANHVAWIAQGQNNGAAQGWIQAFVICVAVAQ